MSLTLRSIVALFLFVGFYALAIGLAGLLFFLPVAEILWLDRIHFKLAIVSVIAGGVILWSVMPRFDRFQPPGPRLRREDHPELFATIDDIARAAEQTAPAEVYLVPDVNAFVMQRGGLLGFGSRRVMGIGLPLLQVLSVTELRAVLAHEFGHYHGGDTALGPFIYRTRSAMARTVSNLSGSGVLLLQIASLPFKVFGELFLRVTLAISRAQEYAADALAARLEGPEAMKSSLRTVHGAAVAFQPYFEGELVPVLGKGHRPPFADGFARFVSAESIAPAIARAIDAEIESGVEDTYDSHPCLRDRLAALDGVPDRQRETDDRRAVSLLGDLSAVELALLDHLLVIPVADLDPVDWEEVGVRVTLPDLRQTLAEVDGLLDTPLAELPVTEDALLAVASSFRPGLPPEEQRRLGTFLVQAATIVTLADRGWTVLAFPGAPLAARPAEGGDLFVPSAAIERGLESDDPGQSWVSALRAAGIVGPATRPLQ